MFRVRIDDLYRAAAAVRPRRISACIAIAPAAGLLLSACAAQRPSMFAAAPSADEITGGIVSRASLDAVQPNRAAAIRLALEPSAEGAEVAWIDPESGRRGTVAAAGPAFVSRDRLCRAFTVVTAKAGASERSVGSACRIGAGPWSLGEFETLPDRA